MTTDGEAHPPPTRPLRICYISDERYPSRWTDTQQVMKTATALAREPVTVDLVLPRMWRTLWADSRARRGVLERYYGVEPAFELTQIPSVPPSRWRIEKLTHGLLAPLYAAIKGYDLVYTRDVLAVLAALSLAILPVLILYLIFSRQLIRGITSGAVK